VPPCIFKTLTGLYCPGCGTGRALMALTRLDFAAAFLYNPLLFLIVMPFAAYMGTIYIMRKISGRWIPSIFSTPKAALPVLAVIIGMWVFRNVFPLGLG